MNNEGNFGPIQHEDSSLPEQDRQIEKINYQEVPFFALYGMRMGYQSMLDRAAGKSIDAFDPATQKIILEKEAYIAQRIQVTDSGDLAAKGQRLKEYLESCIGEIDQELRRRKDAGDLGELW